MLRRKVDLLDPAGLVRRHHERDRPPAEASSPPPCPGTRPRATPRSRAAAAAASRFGLSPLVLCSISRSPGPAERLDLPGEDLLEAEVVPRGGEQRGVGGERDRGERRGGSARKRTTYSVAMCCASAALPPLPAKKSVPACREAPRRSARRSPPARRPARAVAAASRSPAPRVSARIRVAARHQPSADRAVAGAGDSSEVLSVSGGTILESPGPPGSPRGLSRAQQVGLLRPACFRQRSIGAPRWSGRRRDCRPRGCRPARR